MAITDIFSELDGLAKMTIDAYPDEEYNDGDEIATFQVMYNPNTYSQEYKNNYERPTTQGNTGTLVFTHTEPENVSFEFLFDATGASLSGTSNIADQVLKDKHTDDAIKNFLEVTYQRSGDTHQPNFLKLRWGNFEFRGLLESATVTHKLFNLDGNPIRSTVACSFRKHTSLQEQAAQDRKSSPDLTHYRLVKAGDTLPRIANKIYGDPSFYLEIARVNKLINFRKLKVGQKLILPPIDKKK
ncbi:MAG: LysM peptidoglycan-binding domain-containing protein [Flavobacteriales bacterium]|nr:LysM peptidoglycan-binding domain-containing protein [Flavobacteriales bacterium]